MNEGFIPPHGGYQKLLSYRKVEIVYDATVRKMGRGMSYATYESQIEQTCPETAANTIICLLHQTNYLLDRQLKQLEDAFLKEGGLRERMTRARIDARKKARS